MLQALRSATWKVISAGMLAGQALSSVLMGVQGRPPFAPEQLGLVIAAGFVASARVFVSAWTWRRVVGRRDAARRQAYS
jgi:hypothetical protein